MRSLIPWNTMDIQPFSTELENFFGRLIDKPSGQAGHSAHIVRLDWTEDDEAIVVRAEIPGVPAEDLEITVTGDLLTLAGEKKVGADEDAKAGYTERVYGAFRRQLKLPFPVATDQVSAESTDGVLTIRLPKAESQRSRRIEVKGA